MEILELTPENFIFIEGELYSIPLIKSPQSFLLVYADWCRYCIDFKPTYINASRNRMYPNVQFSQLNEKNKGIVRILQEEGIVKSYPTLLYIKDGNISNAIPLDRARYFP